MLRKFLSRFQKRNKVAEHIERKNKIEKNIEKQKTVSQDPGEKLKKKLYIIALKTKSGRIRCKNLKRLVDLYE